MARAFQCDVCGGFEADEPVCKVAVTPQRAAGQKTYELCAACLARLHDTLVGPSTGDAGS